VTYQMIRDLLDRLRQDRPKLAPLRVWYAYAHLDEEAGSDDKPHSQAPGVPSHHSRASSRHSREGGNPVSELTALVSLIRRVCGLDATLTPYATTVRRNFQDWIMRHHSGAGQKFNEEQMAWLHMIRDHVISSFNIERDDLEMAPFDARGGMGRMYQLFGERMDDVLGELNRELVA
jgi:type I restriction enzyme R subunit